MTTTHGIPEKPQRLCPICKQPYNWTPRRSEVDAALAVIPIPTRSLLYWRIDYAGHESCRETEIEMERQAAERREAQAKHDALLEILAANGISAPVYERSTFANFKIVTENSRAYAAMLNWTDDSQRGFMLTGRPGTGKTHLLIAAFRKAADGGSRKWAYRNLNKWFSQMRNLLNVAPEQVDIERTRLERARVLILDDLGAEKMSEWAESTLEQILSARLDECLPTHFSTNLTAQGLSQRHAPRTLSRILGLSDLVEIGGPDHRLLR